MTIARRILFPTVLLLICSSAYAAVYRTVDEHGNVVFTDDPGANGEPVKLPPLSTVPPPKYTGKKESVPEDIQPQAPVYEIVRIVAPTQDETLRDNPGNVTVKVAVKPKLDKAAGHRIQYYLDGQPWLKPSPSGTAVLSPVDRGTHTVAAAVVNASGEVLKRSDDVRFYLHRQSINFPNRPGGAPAPAPVR